MLAEVNQAQKHIIAHHGANPEPGDYAVPTQTSRGDAFMKVTLNKELSMSGFRLFWDKEFTLSWYDFNKDGSKREG
jgi:hypothetical protein